ncbi:uncharacterized protein LOC128552902 [Mercenaria mercenaria]|uniref:uncharacterized protein LOC128552902 n=1 Tax=Mercenaria mercenaria TaxID=6596 RepID=UPI00234EEF44|nr:uncharacterized protein LOC128552902 [Mercenaria mercenaria]
MDAGSALNTGQEFIPIATFLTKSDTRKTERRNIHRPTRPSVKPKSVQVPTCVYCKGEHSSTNCVKIKDHEQRLNILKEKQLCFNCLRSHKVSECRSKFNCMICSRRHHTSLCEEESRKKSTDEPPKTHDAKETQSSVLHSAHNFALGPVLLKTAVSMVTSSCTSTTAIILFDEGSQSSFITERLAQKLQLQPTGSETLCLSGFGDTERRIRRLDTATVYLQTPEVNIPIKVLIVPEISVTLKTYQKRVGHLPYLKRLKLAHPMSEEDNFEIEILVGADHYWDIVQDTIIRGDGPTAIQSRIGYLLSGPLSTENQIQPSPFPVSMLNVMTMHVQEEVNLERFWEVESLGVEQKSVHQGYEEYTKQYQNTGISYENGKYIAKLPWKENHPFLPSNELISRRRTVSVVNRLRKEPELLQKYGEILSEQEKRGFIEKITDVKSSENTKVHYIPHHPVKKDSATTPIRIVYDCSCKSTRDSPTLNECLMKTPPILNDLTAILLRFRYHEFAVSTDIEKAFLNIGLHPDDRDVTRFFWLSDPNNPDSPLQIYRFKSVLFGATCSPFILNATVTKHLALHRCDDTERIQQGLYVDNILTSVPDESTLLDFYTNSRQLFQKASLI